MLVRNRDCNGNPSILLRFAKLAAIFDGRSCELRFRDRRPPSARLANICNQWRSFPTGVIAFRKKGVGYSLIITVVVVVIMFLTKGHIDEELAELIMTFVLICIVIHFAFSLMGFAVVFAAAILVDEERPTRDDHGAIIPNDLQLP